MRELMIKLGIIVPHEDLYAQYIDQAPVGPSFSQPWHADDKGLRMDAKGRFWTAYDVQEAVAMDYEGVAPSMAAFTLTA